MLVLDERQQDILMKFKQSIKEASQKLDLNNKHIDDNKIANEDKINKLCGRYVHSSSKNEFAIRGMNYEELKTLKRGDVVWVDLRTNVGSEQRSDENGRPVIIIQNNIGNAYAPTIIAVCVTSQTKSKLPTHVNLPTGNGLSKDSIALTEQIMTLDKKRRILRKTGHIDDITMKKIHKATLISIGDLQEKNALEKLSPESRNYIINKFKFIETCKKSIEFLQQIKGDKYSIDLAEDEKFKEENALQYYCYNNNINYNEIYNNYIEIEKRKEESMAL